MKKKTHTCTICFYLLCTASLPFYWRQALAQGHTTSVFILSSNTVSFIPTTQGVFLLDSHLHGNSGDHVAFANVDNRFIFTFIMLTKHKLEYEILRQTIKSESTLEFKLKLTCI